MRLGLVFDHPLFGWSDYDGNKSPKHGPWVQGYLGAQIVFCLRGPLAIGQAGNLASPPLLNGNQSKNQSVHKDSFNNPSTNERFEEAVVVDWSKMMKFKAS
ncbi:hypothetical protein AVEN_91469-1 [Araneus ventricosus]|uniref:Uncharacterized protein n=1 Tax=Araneus ventricosus TaxID=182803 RepID=A0A4Y2BLK5_ARAVE|nr:hypothetical protein AVEN_91469-1 [Araneus ventricosus]